MENKEIREPIQKRSIQKKESIISKGFELICQKGYYNTNTAEIAKAAGVSTGIVYQYFKDKHDILIAGLEKYGIDILFPKYEPYLLEIEANKINQSNIEGFLSKIIEESITSHTMSQTAHREITAMEHSDSEVAKVMHDREEEITQKFVSSIKQSKINIINLPEKVHLIYGMIDNLCHEIVYHKHQIIDYKVMKQLVIKAVVSLIYE